MKSKGKLLALVAVFGALGVATATGAFTTVTADRTAEVTVSGDQGALLGLNATDQIANNDGGDFTIDLEGETGAGLNDQGVTDFGNVLQITNNGEDEVAVLIELETQDVATGSVHFYAQGSELSDPGTGELSAVGASVNSVSNVQVNSANALNNRGRFAPGQKYSITLDTSNDGDDLETLGVTLGAGQSVNVGLLIDLIGQDLEDGDEVISDITIVAEDPSDSIAGVDGTTSVAS